MVVSSSPPLIERPHRHAKKYGAIYADPPWSWITYSAKGTGRSAVSHYDTMSYGELALMNVARYAADDCCLFLWAIDPLLPLALSLIQDWGFTYRTVGFYWIKINHRSSSYFTGMGYWSRANPEQCLLATRGHPKRLARDVKRLVVAPRREHSRKPDEVPARIQHLVGGPYLELFSRETRPGWNHLGDQAGLFDAGHVETRRQPSDLAKRRGIA